MNDNQSRNDNQSQFDVENQCLNDDNSRNDVSCNDDNSRNDVSRNDDNSRNDVSLNDVSLNDVGIKSLNEDLKRSIFIDIGEKNFCYLVIQLNKNEDDFIVLDFNVIQMLNKKVTDYHKFVDDIQDKYKLNIWCIEKQIWSNPKCVRVETLIISHLTELKILYKSIQPKSKFKDLMIPTLKYHKDRKEVLCIIGNKILQDNPMSNELMNKFNALKKLDDFFDCYLMAKLEVNKASCADYTYEKIINKDFKKFKTKTNEEYVNKFPLYRSRGGRNNNNRGGRDGQRGRYNQQTNRDPPPTDKGSLPSEYTMTTTTVSTSQTPTIPEALSASSFPTLQVSSSTSSSTHSPIHSSSTPSSTPHSSTVHNISPGSSQDSTHNSSSFYNDSEQHSSGHFDWAEQVENDKNN